jgi:hypothetical protein
VDPDSLNPSADSPDLDPDFVRSKKAKFLKLIFSFSNNVKGMFSIDLHVGLPQEKPSAI